MSNHRQTHRSSGNRTHIDSSPNYRNHQQRQQQRSYNPRTSRGPNFGAPYNHDNEDDNHDHEVKEDYLLKYLKIRTYYGEDEIDFEVESDICAICQCEYEDEESIGELHCGHKYHTDCIKQGLLNRKVCPICRARVLPFTETVNV
ncbi:hypothetical protein KY290_005881 [Solanum tuberosum]|uniref:RING-type E3 ubiquitin transferase n=1 Tax=Solanum tuberosum TaxID=4113 RepID=A0ABQ7WFF7_SOLTU|nr:hypothetical protein KY284_005893 [Solanum tuberosum]KAH0723157.1 hypothetical protein KY289_006201 [Solanum tuberosum]KAH0752594.1 hypothetical protein KY285_005742 [Solanum tuberosum]KAH0779454.1 hypothetical protein KY290_005881 [Solanum tuberosum]